LRGLAMRPGPGSVEGEDIPFIRSR